MSRQIQSKVHNKAPQSCTVSDVLYISELLACYTRPCGVAASSWCPEQLLVCVLGTAMLQATHRFNDKGPA